MTRSRQPLLHRLEAVPVERGDADPHRQALDPGPDGLDLLELLELERGDLGAAAGLLHDEALAAQAGQGRAHRHRAHVEVGSQLADREERARLERCPRGSPARSSSKTRTSTVDGISMRRNAWPFISRPLVAVLARRPSPERPEALITPLRMSPAAASAAC